MPSDGCFLLTTETFTKFLLHLKTGLLIFLTAYVFLFCNVQCVIRPGSQPSVPLWLKGLGFCRGDWNVCDFISAPKTSRTQLKADINTWSLRTKEKDNRRFSRPTVGSHFYKISPSSTSPARVFEGKWRSFKKLWRRKGKSFLPDV